MFGLLMPRISMYACSAAPSPGVFVTAPDSTPTIVAISTPVVKWMMYAVAQPSSTIVAAIRFIFRLCLPNDEKKLGPTCRPIEYTNSISPRSLANASTRGSRRIPKCENAMPQNRIHVMPRVIPLNFSLWLRNIPQPITMHRAKIECAIPVPINRFSNQFIVQ